jgi:ankyrin repeat protein
VHFTMQRRTVTAILPTSFSTTGRSWMASRSRWTGLHVATLKGHEQMARFLLERGADVHAEVANKRTALHIATSAANESIAKLLLDKGARADINH